MMELMCPSLRRLGSILIATYRLRDNRLEKGKHTSSSAKPEQDLRRVHQLISLHRSSCRFCKFNEALQGLPTSGLSQRVRYYGCGEKGRSTSSR